jgi:hypothetical protein
MSRISIAYLLAVSAALSLRITGIVAAQGRSSQSPPIQQAARTETMPTEVSYPQVYATPDGETHFRDVKVRLRMEVAPQSAEPLAQSELQPATTIRHAAFPAGWGVYDRDHGIFHNPTSARFVTVRRGVGWIRTSDGETRRVETGDVVEVLDVAPSRGHVFWVGEKPITLLYSNHR